MVDGLAAGPARSPPTIPPCRPSAEADRTIGESWQRRAAGIPELPGLYDGALRRPLGLASLRLSDFKCLSEARVDYESRAAAINQREKLVDVIAHFIGINCLILPGLLDT